MKAGRSLIASACAAAALAVAGCSPVTSDAQADGIVPHEGFVFGDTLTGTIVKATDPKQVGQEVTFTGLKTSSPKVAFMASGGVSPMEVLGETDALITIQLFSGTSIDTFAINKETGVFSRAYGGHYGGAYAGGAVGVCK
jgi:hypothetical protein